MAGAGGNRPGSAPGSQASYFQVAVDGLLQFLRIKGGQGPYQLSLTVDPSIDVTEFYGVQSMVTSQNAAGPVAVPTTVATTLSTNARRVLAASGQWTVGAAGGTQAMMSIGFRINQGQPPVYWATTGPFAPVAAGVYRVGVDCRGIILPPDHQIVMRVDSNAAGADHNFTVEYAYQRLDGLP